MPFDPRSSEHLDSSSPILDDPSSPDQIDRHGVLNFRRLYQFHKYYPVIFYKGLHPKGIWGSKIVVFPISQTAPGIICQTY